jgi:hypothetical protein
MNVPGEVEHCLVRNRDNLEEEGYILDGVVPSALQ